MIQFPATCGYAALLGLLFVGLSIRVIRERRSSGVAIGVAGRPVLERLARVHANFAEYAPLTLILILLVESSAYRPWIVHVLGSALVVGRTIHALGVSRDKEDFRLRVTGMTLTFLTILISSGLLLWGVVAAAQPA